MNSENRILLLRTFRDPSEDVLDIAFIASAIEELGRLVIVGSEDENNSLRRLLMTQGLMEEAVLNQTLDFVNSADSAWRKSVIVEIIRADAVIILFTPKTMEFPQMPVSTAPFVSFIEHYQIAPAEPRTGKGLLSELSLCERLGALPRSLLLANEWQVTEISKFVNTAQLALGDAFIAGSRGVIPALPRLTALDRQIGCLDRVARALALPARAPMTEWNSTDQLMRRAISDSVEFVIASSPPKVSFESRQSQGYLDFGVSDKSMRIFPDYELKVVGHTPVENLLFCPYHNIIEVQVTEVINSFGLDPDGAKCPYCGNGDKFLFFYQERLQVTQDGCIRCKCQFCGRRSTLVDDMLLDM